ncbi:MAG: DUF3592 domain-containing protein [Thainema sp.]
MSNATSEFLGADYRWYNTVVSLEDVQALHGGVKLEVKGSGWATVTRIEPKQRQQKYWVSLNSDETNELKQLLIDHDFLTIQPDERAGLPDESQPVITLKNASGQTHSVAKWAGVKDERFDAIYQALQAIAQPTKDRKPLTPPEPRWLAIAKITGSILVAIAVIILSRMAAIQTLAQADMQDFRSLMVLLLLLTGLVPLLWGMSVFFEWLVVRQKSFFSRPVSLLLVGIGILYVMICLWVIPFTVEAGMAQWGEPTPATVQDKFTSLSYESESGIVNTNYYLRYRYQAPTGKTYTKRASVKARYYASIQEGDTVTVYYLPSWPSWSTLEAAQSATSRTAFILTALLTLVGWLLALDLISYVGLPLVRRIETGFLKQGS